MQNNKSKLKKKIFLAIFIIIITVIAMFIYQIYNKTSLVYKYIFEYDFGSRQKPMFLKQVTDRGYLSEKWSFYFEAPDGYEKPEIIEGCLVIPVSLKEEISRACAAGINLLPTQETRDKLENMLNDKTKPVNPLIGIYPYSKNDMLVSGSSEYLGNVTIDSTYDEIISKLEKIKAESIIEDYKEDDNVKVYKIKYYSGTDSDGLIEIRGSTYFIVRKPSVYSGYNKKIKVYKVFNYDPGYEENISIKYDKTLREIVDSFKLI